jgi:ubiquinone/menaquinone biosynthesis C-methylase UbiE
MDMVSDKEMQKKNAQANADYYNKCAKQYETIEETIFAEENEKRVHDFIRDLSEKYGNESLLDVGCGTGNILRFAVKYFKQVTGADISEEMLELSKKYTKNLVLADATKLPFEDNKFDVVSAYSVLHHLYNPLPAINEMFRVCKKDGVVYTDNDPNGYFQKRFKWYKNLRKKFYKKRMSENIPQVDENFRNNMMLAEYYHYYEDGMDAEKIKEMFISAGFSEVNVYFRYHPRPNLFTKVIKVLLFFEPRVKKCPFMMIIAKK